MGALPTGEDESVDNTTELPNSCLRRLWVPATHVPYGYLRAGRGSGDSHEHR
jgi:hypothetical protein